jgi:nucleoside-diphosphate-sugar epimerase
LADVERAKRELGFAARVTLEEGLRRLAAWRRERASHEREAVAR